MGRLVTPLLKKVYSCEQYKTIGEMKKQMHKDASALFDGLFRKLIYSTACPVSYTHLDVYKRQPYSNAVDDIFEQALESMEGVFALDRVNVFGELAACLLYTSRCV